VKKSVTIEVRSGEAISIDGGRIIAHLLEKSGQRARIRFEAEEGTPIERVKDTTNFRAEMGLGKRELQPV
jgi:hypothetical protein